MVTLSLTQVVMALCEAEQCSRRRLVTTLVLETAS
jgi:hypothetical protein